MLVKDFLARVAAHPHLAVVHRDATMCVIERNGSVPKQTIRMGLWAVRRLRWDEFTEAWDLPKPTP